MPKILIVDDSSTIRKVIGRLICKVGLQPDDLQEASDGLQAIEALKNDSFDLIISDINMPNMNGVEFISLVKSMGIKTPILVVSSESEDKFFITIKYGAGGFMKKSLFVHFMELLSSDGSSSQE